MLSHLTFVTRSAAYGMSEYCPKGQRIETVHTLWCQNTTFAVERRGGVLLKDSVCCYRGCSVLLPQDKGSISSKERAAAKQLADWLAHIDISDSSDTDEALDESSRALLASFTDRYSRKRLAVRTARNRPGGLTKWRTQTLVYSCFLLQNGLGNVIGGSPSLRASFFVKHQKLQGQEDLATELDKVSESSLVTQRTETPSVDRC